MKSFVYLTQLIQKSFSIRVKLLKHVHHAESRIFIFQIVIIYNLIVLNCIIGFNSKCYTSMSVVKPDLYTF